MLHLHHHHHTKHHPHNDENSDHPNLNTSSITVIPAAAAAATPATAMSSNTPTPPPIPAPELDLYRAHLSITQDGTRHLDRLGAKSRWRPAPLETQAQEKLALLGRDKKRGWFDKEKEAVVKGLRGLVAEFDARKGEVLRGLGVRVEGLFDTAVLAYPDATSFDVRMDRHDDGRIEAVLFVDEERGSKGLGSGVMGFEDAVAELKREVAAVQEERERGARGVGGGDEEVKERPEDEEGFWQS
ncbi:hypothetical protein K505DRAFT_336587 [Melanomma pulvis-pyrius CBS 109.77]|uniref:Uncharacterized protein n=1 Tax=Melanomma pulvis-pyrius CBS 109.77 TaxID=1314802 RepID=A0A6A6XE47_9PLEO|nr:hypothetical protein K505DRAFT_336587 [Melanomma pulvis-pyrius CBS 109.77]